MATFTDSIDENLDLLEELVRGLPAGSHHQAKAAVDLLANTVHRIRRDSQGNPGAAIGTAWAIYKLAQQMVRQGENGEDHGQKLIQLAN